MEFAKRVAVSACVMFTVFMTVGCVGVMAFTGPQYGLVMSLTFLLASVLFALLRGLWFTDKLIRGLSYPLRIMGFGVTGFLSLALCARIGEWLPADNPGAWASFTVIFLAVLAAFCIGYQIYFKRTVGSFDAALRRYHERMGR